MKSEHDFSVVEMAEPDDLEEILSLQKLAFKSQAEIYNDFNIQPLTQTLEELREEARKSVILKLVLDSKIVGSVRAFEKDGSCYIGKLAVHPEYQNRGLGRKLMTAIEQCFDGVRYELFTGYLSEKNLAMYESLGYERFKTQKVGRDMELIYLEKKPQKL